MYQRSRDRQEITYFSHLIRFCVTTALVTVLIVSGCGYHPTTMEVYQGTVPNLGSDVKIRADRSGLPNEPPTKSKYSSFTPVIRFSDGNGTIWQLYIWDNDPGSWELWVIPQGKQAKKVPLTLVYEGISGAWPDTWPRLKFPVEEGNQP